MLPIEPIKASRINPRLLVIYGKSKCGKTTAASMLPNSLILDFEDGSDFVSALKVKILGLNSPSNESPESRQKRQDSGRYFINEVLLEIREFRRKNNRYPYERVIIDTGTRFEELCEDVATLDYMNSPQGSKFNRDQTGNILPKSQGESALTLPMGLGYGYLRQAFNRGLAVIKEMAPDVIMICHVKDKFVNKSGKEMTANDLNLTGRVAQILAAQSDAIGYVYRKKNQTFINFASADDTCG
ncbi:MAG TPA: AAA family ATPase, partial [Candidatus Absconditabacterales bacterium]|nr:AAA family ATPase [Candidatus Absconditabacterales bacterium]